MDTTRTETVDPRVRVLGVLKWVGVLLALLVVLSEQARSGILQGAPQLAREILGLVPTRAEPAGLVVLIVGVVIAVVSAAAQSLIKARVRRGG